MVAIGGFTSGFACQWPEDIIPSGCYAPSVSVPGFAASGSNYGVRDITDVYQIRSNYSKIVGNHTFKVGGNWNTNDYFGPGFGGGVTFSALQTADPVNPGGTGSGLASYLLSVPALGRRRGNIEEVRGHRVYGFYFQDTWKVTNRLTLNLGVRNDATIFGHYGSDELNNNKVGNLNLILGAMSCRFRLRHARRWESRLVSRGVRSRMAWCCRRTKSRVTTGLGTGRAALGWPTGSTTKRRYEPLTASSTTIGPETSRPTWALSAPGRVSV